MFRLIWKLLYSKGTINFGNGSFDAKRNKITGTITLLLSKDLMNQLFKDNADE